MAVSKKQSSNFSPSDRYKQSIGCLETYSGDQMCTAYFLLCNYERHNFKSLNN